MDKLTKEEYRGRLLGILRYIEQISPYIPEYDANIQISFDAIDFYEREGYNCRSILEMPHYISESKKLMCENQKLKEEIIRLEGKISAYKELIGKE